MMEDTTTAPFSAAAFNGHTPLVIQQAPERRATRLSTVLGALALMCITIVLSVVATIYVMSVAQSGVLLPQYLQYNQPSKTSQLGFCVSQHKGHLHIWQAVNGSGYCYRGSYVHVQPKVVAP